MSELLPISFPCGKAWYVAYTGIRAELLAKAKLEASGFECFAPYGRRRAHRKNSPAAVSVAFPRYLFVRFDINRDEWGQILDCWEIEGLIRTDGIPVRVPDRVIDGLMALQDAGFYDERPASSKFFMGDKIRAIGGPFVDKLGQFVKATKRDKAEILFGLLSVEMPLAQIERA